MTNEQKLREALQEYDTAFSDFNPENKKSRERMRRAVVKAREALAQPTSDEGTPLTEAYLGEIFEDHRARGLDDFDHYRDMTGKLAGKCRELERTLHAKERELAAPVDPDDERANPVWDLVIQACAHAWTDKNKLFYDGCPTELITRIIDERDELQEQLATLQSVSAAPQDEEADAYTDEVSKKLWAGCGNPEHDNWEEDGFPCPACAAMQAALPSGYVQVPSNWKLGKGINSEGDVGPCLFMDNTAYGHSIPQELFDFLQQLIAATPTPSDSKPGEGKCQDQ